jgi:hypothetical protein
MTMKKPLRHLPPLLVLLAAVVAVRADDAKTVYENNFERVEVGKLPGDKAPDYFLVVDGAFATKEEGGNKFLELPGAPLDTFGAVFGPTTNSDVAVSARIKGTKNGRRFPAFAVGLNGQGGYRLQVSPGKGTVELFKGDDSVANAPFEWKSGEWTWLRLQILKTGDTWKLEGKAWLQGGTEPSQPLVVFEDKKEPNAGRASIWGSPYATTPIDYDDIMIKQVGPAK